MGVVAAVCAVGTGADITLAVMAAVFAVDLDAAVDDVLLDDDEAAVGVVFFVAEVVDEPPAAEVVDGVDVDSVAGVLVLGDVVEEVPVVAVLVVEPPEALEVLEFDPPLDVDFADDVPDDELLAVDDVVPVVADVVVDVDDPDAAGVFADEPVVEVEADEDVDEEVDDFELEVSASAIAGLLATALPIPNAIANAPTRPMYLPSDPAATAACSFSDSARAGSAACRPLVFGGALSRVIEAVMSPPLPTPGFPAM